MQFTCFVGGTCYQPFNCEGHVILALSKLNKDAIKN